MRRTTRLIAAAALATLTTAALGALSRLPYGGADGEAALVRLSWRYRGEREEECRQLSDEELARLPAHMRQPVVCEGQIASFLLEVAIDGTTTARDTVRSAGVSLELATRIALEPGEIVLATLDADGSRLVMRGRRAS
ncbi:MAG: hypothetical protein HY701_01140 [Gemmatimonadetes bacterium]|nr:hypothetical protein [Gemmatimonadota bacterium]